MREKTKTSEFGFTQPLRHSTVGPADDECQGLLPSVRKKKWREMEKGRKNPIVSLLCNLWSLRPGHACMQEGNGVNLDGTPLLAPVEVDV